MLSVCFLLKFTSKQFSRNSRIIYWLQKQKFLINTYTKTNIKLSTLRFDNSKIKSLVCRITIAKELSVGANCNLYIYTLFVWSLKSDLT